MAGEAWKIKYDIVPYVRGRGLDVGCGGFKAWPWMTGLDTAVGWKYKLGADVYCDARDLGIFATESLDYVFSSHCLEDLEDTVSTLREWWRVIRPGGHLILYLPHRDLYPRIGEPGANPAHRHDFSPEMILDIMGTHLSGWDCIENEVRDHKLPGRGPNGTDAKEYSFLQVYKKEEQPLGVIGSFSYKQREGEKICLVCRYGGIGDTMTMSSVLPVLKKRGYYLMIRTSLIGEQILKHDPHVDEIYCEDPGQVPRDQFGDLIESWKRKGYDMIVNLNETIEVAGLGHPTRVQYYWPKELRHHYFNFNYLELLHMAAETSYEPAIRFYPTDEERAWSNVQRNQMEEAGAEVIIHWVLAGSGSHKWWPHTIDVVCQLLDEYPQLGIVTSGGLDSSLPMENCIPDHPRLFRRVNVNRLDWDIRQTLTFAEHSADMVVGPETGILVAVAFRDKPKVLFLSHSTVENLSRDWVDTETLVPGNECECYPCHRLFYKRPDLNNDKDCPKDPNTGAALCQVAISRERGIEAIRKQLNKVLYSTQQPSAQATQGG